MILVKTMKLSQIASACNIQLLGNQKKTLSGFSQTSTLPHTGFIFNSPIVQDTPPVSFGNCFTASQVDLSNI